MKPVRVEVNDLMQKGYVYFRTKPMGRDFRAGFTPDLTPRQMLELGVFGGKYMTDCRKEFPASWFKKAKLCRERHEASLNFFGVNASQPLSVWREEGLDLSRRSPRLVSVVLPLLFRPPVSGRFAPDQTVARRAAASCPTKKELRSRRSHLPPKATAGVAALGV